MDASQLAIADAVDGSATPQDDVAFRARANARHRAMGLTLGRAESTERAALEKLQRILPATNN